MASSKVSLKLLLEFDLAVSLPEVSPVIAAALHFYEKHFTCDRVSLSLFDEDYSGMVMHTNDLTLPRLSRGERVPASKAEILALLSNKDPLYCPDMSVLKKPTPVERLLIDAGYRTGLIVPLMVDQAVVGSINFDSRNPAGISASDRKTLVLLSSRLSLALHHAQIHDSLVKNEQALKASEREYRDLVEQAGDAILKSDPKGRLVQANQAAVQLLGYSMAELINLHFEDLFSPAVLQVKPLRYDLIQKGQTVITEREISHKDGHQVRVEMNTRRLTTGNFICIVRDLTERFQSQKRLQDREAKLLEAQELAHLGNWEYAFFEDQFTASEKFCEMLGVEPDQLNGSLSKYVALIHPDDRKSFELALADTSLHNKALDITHRLQAAGRELWFSLRGSLKAEPGTAPPVMAGTAQDVTDLYSTQKALHTSEARAQRQFQLLRSIADNSPNLVWAENAQGQLSFVNKEFCRFVLQASSTSEPLGATLENLLRDREGSKGENQLLSSLVAFKQDQPDADALNQVELSGTLGGKTVYLNVSRARIKDFQENISGTVYSAYDISEQKRQTLEVENSRHQIAAFLDAVPAPLYAKDRNGCYVHLNDEYLSFFGKTAEEMIGKTVHECWDPDVARQFEVDDRLLLEKNERQSYHTQLRNSDGLLRNIMVHKSRFFDANGEVAGLIGTLWDYSELSAAEQRYHNLFDYSPIPVVVHDFDNILAANKAATDFFGAGDDIGAYLNHSVLEFIHPDFHESAASRAADVLKSNKPNTSMEQKFITYTGEFRDVEVMAAPVTFENKPAVLTSFRDITEEKLNRERLQVSENNYRNLMDVMPNPVLVHVDGRLLYANQAALIFAGKESMAECEGLDLFSFVHPDSRAFSRENLAKIIETGQGMPPMDQRYIRGDGQVRDVESRAVPLNYEGEAAVLVSFIDNTERASARRELQESRLQLEMVTDHVTHFILLVDYDFKILYGNRSCARFFRMDKDDFIGLPADRIIVKPALDKARVVLDSLQEGESAGFSFIYNRPPGPTSEYWTTLIPITSRDGNTLAFLAQIEDITERERARKELAENKELLELIIDTIPDLLSYTDASERYLYANEAYARWHGKQKTEILNDTIVGLLGEKRHHEIRHQLEAVMSGEVLNFSRVANDRQGVQHIFDVRYIPHFDRNQHVKAFLAVSQDVTGQRQAENYQEALRHLASALTRPMSLHDIGKEAAQTIHSVFQSDAIAIEIFDDLAQVNRGIYSEDTFLNEKEPREVPHKDLPYSEILPTHHDPQYQATCTNRSEADLKHGLETIIFGDDRLSRSLLNIPIRWEGRAIGLISVQSYVENTYSEKDIPRLQVFGDQIGVAIMRAQQDAEILAHQELVEREERKYRAIIARAGDAVFVLSLEGQILIVNDRAASSLGYTQSELNRLHMDRIDPVFYVHINPGMLSQLERKGETVIIPSTHTRKDGSVFPVELRISMTEIDDRSCVLVFARDITARKLAESREVALRELAHRLNESKDMGTVGWMAAQSIRAFFESDAFAIEFYDHDRGLIVGVYSEDTLEEGGSPQAVPPRDTPFSEVRMDFFDLNAKAHVRNRTAEELTNIQRSRPFGSGRLSHSLLFAPIIWGDRNIGVLTVQSYTHNKYSDADLGNIQLFADQIGGALMRSRADARLLVQTNALLKSELELTQLLKEKDILLKEVYHRTKNNMQVIVGLLDMQSYKTDNQQTLDVLHEMTDRISSMSLVHDLLYRSKSLADIRLDTYLDKLATRLLTAYQLPSQVIDLNLLAEPIRITIQLAVPLGLVINEMITNALKYAFPQHQNGELRISAQVWRKNGLELSVGDNGVGLPAEFDPLLSDSLGMKIIRDIVELQLLGELVLDRSSGVVYLIRIPDISLEGKGL